MARSAESRRRAIRAGQIALAIFLLLCAYAGFEYGRLPQAWDLERKNPETTALIEQRALEARAEGKKPRRRQTWVPLERISKTAVDAVLISEDARFFQHGGFDLDEARLALEEAWAEKKLGRGASTITQQLAKNLWLSGDRSLVRKMKEAILAKRLEEALTKRRILTLYLNVAEWGDGVYGIEAAAQAHFGVSAAELSTAEAVVLASMLPAPRRWTLDRRPAALRARAERLLDKLARHGRISGVEAGIARLELQSIFEPGPGVR